MKSIAGTPHRGAPRFGIIPRLVGADGSSVDAARVSRKPGCGVVVRVLDFQTRRLQWTGNGGTWELVSSTPVDFDRQTNGDVLVTAMLRIDSLPEGEVVVFASDNAGARGELQVRDWLASLPANQWFSVAIPLKCLRAAGAPMQKLDVPIGIRSAPGLALSIQQIQLGTTSDHRLDCPTQ